ncbi:MAG: hypothetical protein QGG96_05295 [Candidatus Poseidoniaceae archaeon]|nr:hypothetical protein [Candidatus Poseidoniaceae archaeon]
MSGQEVPPNPLMKSSFVPFAIGMMAFMFGWEPLGICGFVIGIIMMIIAGLSQATAEGFGAAQGKMVLKQDESGQWGWTQTGGPANSAQNSNMGMLVQQQVTKMQPQMANLQPDNQRMKLLISEVSRGNIDIKDLELKDVNSIASTFGVQTSSSKGEVIKNLVLSPNASKALKITGATLAGIGTLTTVAGAAKVARHVNDKKDLTGKARQAIEDAKEAIAEKKEAVIDDFDSKLDEVVAEIENKVEGAEQYLEEEIVEEELSDDITEVENEDIIEDDVVEEEAEVEEIAEEMVVIEEEVASTDEPQSPPAIIIEAIELDEGINTPLEMAIETMENARLSSERRAIMAAENSVHMVTLKISKFEKTLLGDATYRGGQSVSGLIDGGPYEGLVKIPVELDEEIMACKDGDTITLYARIVDFSPSRRRPVLEATEFA